MENGDIDFSSAIDTLKTMLSSDDGQAKINNIINAFTDGGVNDNVSSPQNDIFGDISQMDMMIKLGNILSDIKSEQNGKNARLLYAIKPYLNQNRQSKTDGAIKIMGMVKAFAAMKDSGISLDNILT